MDGYFEEFKGKMRNRLIIPHLVVDHYYDDICFMVEIDYTYAQVVLPKVAWIRPMQYEVNIDEIIVAMIAFLSEEIDKNSKPFNTYEKVKIKMMMQTKVPKMGKKRRKMVVDLEGKRGEGSLHITKGKGEDEECEEEEKSKSKGK